MRGLKLSAGRRIWIFTTVAVLTVSGAAWLVCQHWFRVEAEFGSVPHPSAPWWLRLHGAAAMVFLVLLGTLLRDHIGAGWRAQLNRASGGVMVGVCFWLTLTGYGLYYSGDEWLRLWVSRLHWVPGLILPAILLAHIYLGRRRR